MEPLTGTSLKSSTFFSDEEILMIWLALTWIVVLFFVFVNTSMHRFFPAGRFCMEAEIYGSKELNLNDISKVSISLALTLTTKLSHVVAWIACVLARTFSTCGFWSDAHISMLQFLSNSILWDCGTRWKHNCRAYSYRDHPLFFHFPLLLVYGCEEERNIALSVPNLGGGFII